MARYVNPVQQSIDGNGTPRPGSKLFFYEVGTVILKTIYEDSDFKTAQTNPVIADANGEFTDEIFLDGLYDVVHKTSTDVTVWGPYTIGQTVTGPLELWSAANTYNIPDIVLGSDDNYYRSLTDTNTGNDPTTAAGNWEQLEFGRVWNVNITYAEGKTVYGTDGFLYISTVSGNVGNNPVSSPGQWRAAVNNGQSAIAAGTVDVITAAFPIAFQALNDETIVYVRASGANTSTTPTFAPDGLTAKTIVKSGNQALIAGDIIAAGHELQLKYSLANDVWELMNPRQQALIPAIVSADLPTGTVVQKESILVTSTALGTITIPFDNTIPQITEGNDFVTLSFTPKFDDSELFIEFVGNFASDTGGVLSSALFKDAIANAIAASSATIGANDNAQSSIDYKMVSGTTSAIEFKVRTGLSVAGNIYINGTSTGATGLGGALTTSLTITEVRG